MLQNNFKTRLDMSHKGEDLVNLFAEDMERAYDILPVTLKNDPADVKLMESWCTTWRRQDRPFLIVEAKQKVRNHRNPQETFIVLVDYKDLHEE